ncbi:leucine-rich repeat-containing protein 58-like [Homarus americanus]|uniref:Leucine-rich repeat-containing protein 58-like n=1 Tax=Homarus americanus TaxID=6706 RepID=A0A8J5JWP4_HOMAM|nr:leucine-rich repeat-containing protein 58-like [Homarus americanus]KAG7165962.1 Leucine-rich repeat-containing protein 58-like [Homarus americanus]
MAVNMYYSSESSDSENTAESCSLDLSYLMLDADSLAVHLSNSIREQHQQQKVTRHSAVLNANDISREASQGSCRSGTRPRTNDVSDRLLLCSLSNTSTSDRQTEQEKDNVLDTVTQRLLLQHNMLLTLPFEIVKFSNLRSLDLSYNNLSHINDFLLQLPELQTLYLHNNNLPDDGLPKDLSLLSKLRELNLSGNQLTRVPNQLYEMNGLRYLYLGNNRITEVLPEIKSMQSLQVLNLGGNLLETVPEELGELQQLGSLVLCDNQLCRLPRTISNLTRLRSLLLHKNNLCCLPVGAVKLRGLMEVSLRDNPLVTRFVNSCARELMYNPPSLLELAARVIKLKKVEYTIHDLPHTLVTYLGNGQRCVNPKCKGMYFTSCVEHIKFVDFCGMYRVPLMHYLCSSRCSSKTPDYYRAASSESESEDDEPAARMKRVLLG